MPLDHSTEETDKELARIIIKGIGGFVLAGVLLFGGCQAAGPQVRLYKANTEKKALIGEAKAKADAAKYEAERAVEVAKANAEAERQRAQGVADAQATISATITPEYIQWLYVDQMDRMAESGKATIIYVPTEGGLPILEAGRSIDAPAPAQS